MIFINHRKFEPKVISFELDRNPYQTKIFTKNKNSKGIIIFSIFHYKAEEQYVDLIYPLVDRGYTVITVCFLHHGDHVLSFDYYYHLFENYFKDVLIKNGIVSEATPLILMGVGIGANLVVYANRFNIKISKNILISPVNSYKDEFSISNAIEQIKVPTFIFYGQFDKENSVDSRYAIFQKSRKNNNVHFQTYPCAGHLCYYDKMTSIELDNLYRKNSIDILVGTDRRSQPLFLPTNALPNELFFKHLFNALDDKENPKRILLITETFPTYACGKGTSIEFLRKELEKLGYETYIAGLWKKNDDFANLKNFYIPIIAPSSFVINNNEHYLIFSGTNYQREAKMLCCFGFTYLHLYTQYQMAKVGLELSKRTGIVMPYTYHTLWRLYYKKKINELIKDTSNSHRFAGEFIKSKVYKNSKLIVTQSKKSYQIFKKKKSDKEIVVNTTPMNVDMFYFSKSDSINVEILRKEHLLKGKKIIGYINKVSPEVNTYELITYFSKLSNKMNNIVLMIIGAGAATDVLKRYARKYNVDKNVIFVKDVSNEERKWYFHLFDVFLSGSDFELQGSPYFEAAYSGTPIVAKHNECMNDMFIDGENAYIYSNYEEFTSCMEKALWADNKEIIANAKALAKKYSPEKWAKQMLKYYSDLNKNIKQLTK